MTTVFVAIGPNTFAPVEKMQFENYLSQLMPGTYVVRPTEKGLVLQAVDNFSPPEKVYFNGMQKVERILSTHKSRPNNTGVLFSGEKGSGKTMLTKQLAAEAVKQGYVVLLVNAPFSGDNFFQFLKSITQPSVVLVDEFEKVYDKKDQAGLLTLLDGLVDTNKLFVFTVNDTSKVHDLMLNRPGRIYYHYKFTSLSYGEVKEYCLDQLQNKGYVETVCRVVDMYGHFNFDQLKALVEEMNRYNESPQEALGVLNIQKFEVEHDYIVEAFYREKQIVTTKPMVWHGNPVTTAEFNVPSRFMRAGNHYVEYIHSKHGKKPTAEEEAASAEEERVNARRGLLSFSFGDGLLFPEESVQVQLRAVDMAHSDVQRGIYTFLQNDWRFVYTRTRVKEFDAMETVRRIDTEPSTAGMSRH